MSLMAFLSKEPMHSTETLYKDYSFYFEVLQIEFYWNEFYFHDWFVPVASISLVYYFLTCLNSTNLQYYSDFSVKLS